MSHNSSGAGNASYHKPSHRGTKHLDYDVACLLEELTNAAAMLQSIQRIQSNADLENLQAEFLKSCVMAARAQYHNVIVELQDDNVMAAAQAIKAGMDFINYPREEILDLLQRIEEAL